MRLPLSVLPVVALLAGGLSAAACSDNREPLGPEPGQRPAFVQAPQLQFLTWWAEGPPLQILEASVGARPGESSRLTISYQRYYGDPENFLRLDIDDESLFLRPDGTLFRQGAQGQPWQRVHSVRVLRSETGLEIRTRVHLGGFTRFALAIGR